MRSWLEQLFRNEDLLCTIGLVSWVDEPRQVEVSVIVENQQVWLFRIEIEALVGLTQTELVMGFIKPVADTIRSQK